MRKVLWLTGCLLLAVGVAAFANGTKESGSSSSSGGNVALAFYNYGDVTDPAYQGFKDKLAAFQKENPNITMNVEVQFNEPYHQKLQTMVASNQLPDIMYLWPSARTGYVTSRGLAANLVPLLGSNASDFQSSAVAAQGPNGELWELPERASTATTVVYTNTALLKQLGLTYPKTLADLIAQSAKIRAAGLTPIAMADKDGWETESCLLSTIVGRLGGNSWINNANMQQSGATFLDPQFVNALAVVKQMADAKLFPDGITTMDYNAGLQMFEQQKAVYLIDGDWRVTTLEKDLSDDMKANVQLNTFPSVPGETVQSTISNIPSTGYGMNASLTGAKKDAAWKWIWFDAGPEGSLINLKYGNIPSYQKLDLSNANLGALTLKLIQFYKDVPGTQTVLDGIMDPKPIGILNPDLQLLMLGQKTPQQVAQEVQDWYKQNPPSK